MSEVRRARLAFMLNVNESAEEGWDRGWWRNESMEGISLWYLNRKGGVDIESHIMPPARVLVQNIYHLMTVLVPVKPSPMIDQFDIVKGRLAERSSHWITSLGRLSQPEDFRRGARSKALVLSRPIFCTSHRDIVGYSWETCRSTHWAVSIEWRYERRFQAGTCGWRDHDFRSWLYEARDGWCISSLPLISEFRYLFFELASLGTSSTRLSIPNHGILSGGRTLRAAIPIAPWIKLEYINYKMIFSAVTSTYRRICVGVHNWFEIQEGGGSSELLGRIVVRDFLDTWQAPQIPRSWRKRRLGFWMMYWRRCSDIVPWEDYDTRVAGPWTSMS